MHDRRLSFTVRDHVGRFLLLRFSIRIMSYLKSLTHKKRHRDKWGKRSGALFSFSFFSSAVRTLVQLLRGKMKLFSVYVAVGAISFVKCELGSTSVGSFHGRHANQIPSGEWSVKEFENQSEPEVSEGSDVVPEPGVESDGKRVILEGFRGLRDIFGECQSKISKRLKKLVKSKVNSRLLELRAYVLSLYQCVKVFGFRAFDEVLKEDRIPITDFVSFVKDGVNVTAEDASTGRSGGGRLPMKEYAIQVLGQEWTTLLYERLEELLRTHSLKVQLEKSLVFQGRGRRRDHRMFAMMVMGFMIMASILIPMGFQFLTVLGGKSLLLAKLALIMSAINGLKKIATSNVGYGFYHTGSDHHDHIHHGFHEKNYNSQNHNFPGFN